MLSTPLICCSMGVATDCSMVCGVRAHIDCRNLNFRRRNSGELRDGQANDHHRAHDHGEDGDHHRYDRPIDEEFGHRCSQVCFTSLRTASD